MTDAQAQALNGPGRPLLFRAAEGLYATGSIFKPITMAAGLERGGFKPTDTFDCGLDWKGLPGFTLHNWKAEGTLNLIQGLTGSCDPTFYTIGLKLSQLDPNILPTYARAFGLGQSTGTAGVSDAPGVVPDPAWKAKNVGQPWFDGDGVNLAIGQGYLLSTPLQMANAFSALANRGTVRTPVLISRVNRPDGSVVKSYAAETRGTIPISPTNLGYILEGMRGVTSTPLGTAYYAWKGSPIPMEAKTGSAENETKKAHAWFVGYTTPDHPTVLTLVMLEGGELGGEFAAPLGRQIVEYVVAHPLKPATQ
jgi:penicillin-binding protein 2